MRSDSEQVLETILETKREEVTLWLRRLHNEELHKLYSSSGITGNSRLAGGGLTGLQVNRESFPPLTTMSRKEFAHICEPRWIFPYDSSMLGWGLTSVC
jgi:hypothetical protein